MTLMDLIGQRVTQMKPAEPYNGIGTKPVRPYSSDVNHFSWPICWSLLGDADEKRSGGAPATGSAIPAV